MLDEAEDRAIVAFNPIKPRKLRRRKHATPKRGRVALYRPSSQTDDELFINPPPSPDTKLSKRKSGVPILRVEVRDTGIGISQEGIDRLFRSFSQVNDGMNRTYGGTGLGLAIAKRLVSIAGGEIGAKSRPGKGSCFWFTWPCAFSSEEVRAEAAAQDRSSLEMPPRVGEARALIIDPSTNSLMAVGLCLRGIIGVYIPLNIA